MRKLLLLLLLAVPAHSQTIWKGKLDVFDGVPSPLGMRELHDGNWLAGFDHQFWHLERNSQEVCHVTFFTAWRAMQGDVAYGPSLGVPIGQLGSVLGSAIGLVAPATYHMTPWLQQLGNWVSLDFYGGYRPTHGADVHSWIYGIGGKVKIPLDLIKGL